MSRRGTRVDVPATIVADGDDVIDVVAHCEITGKRIAPSYHHPGEDPDVEVLRLTVDEIGGEDVSHLIDTLTGAEVDSIVESALEAAAEDDAGRADDAADARREQMRDARWEV